MKVLNKLLVCFSMTLGGCTIHHQAATANYSMGGEWGRYLEHFRRSVRKGNMRELEEYARFPLILKPDSDYDQPRAIQKDEFAEVFDCFLNESGGSTMVASSGGLSFKTQKEEILDAMYQLSPDGKYARLGDCEFAKMEGSWFLTGIYTDCTKDVIQTR
jgi:hypothetical protein